MARKILVVEDEKTTLHLLVTLLRRHGYDVISALDGTQAVMQAHKERPDLILLDLMMPAGDGLNVCQKLQMSSHTSQIPIIVVTGSDQPELEAKVREVRACALIRKPIVAEDLLARVGEALGLDAR